MSEQKQNIYRWLHYDCNPIFAPQKYSLSLAFYSTRSWGKTKITSFNRNKSSERHIFIRTRSAIPNIVGGVACVAFLRFIIRAT